MVDQQSDKTSTIEIQNDIKEIGFENAAFKYSISPSCNAKRKIWDG